MSLILTRKGFLKGEERARNKKDIEEGGEGIRALEQDKRSK